MRLLPGVVVARVYTAPDSPRYFPTSRYGKRNGFVLFGILFTWRIPDPKAVAP